MLILGLAEISEGSIGAALQIHIDFVVANPGSECEGIRQEFPAYFGKSPVLLVRAAYVVAEHHAFRKWPRVLPPGARQGIIGRETECAGGEALRMHRRRVDKIIQFEDFGIAEEDAECGAQAAVRRRGEAQFPGKNRGFGVTAHQGAGVVAVPRGRLGGIGHRSVADVVRQVLAYEEVVGVIDDAVDFAVEPGGGEHGFELAEAPFESQGGIVETVIRAFVDEPLHRQFIGVIEIGVDQEHAVRVDALPHVAQGQPPVEIEFVQAGHAEAFIADGIDVLPDKFGIVGADEVDRRKVRPGLETFAGDAEWNAIAAHEVGGFEAARAGNVDFRRHIVDVAALVVRIDDPAQGEIIVNRQVEHGFGPGAGSAVGGCRDAYRDPGGKTLEIGLGGDQSHVAGLGAGAEQGALGAGKHFHPFQVRGVDIEIAAGLGNRLLVKIQRHVGGQPRHRRDGNGRCGGSHAADVDRALARPAAAGGQARHMGEIVAEIADIELFQGFRAERPQGDGNVLGHFGPPGCGDFDDFDLRLGLIEQQR